MHQVFWVVILLSYVATVLKSQLLESGDFLYESQLTKKATPFISVQGNFKDANPKSLENFGWRPKKQRSVSIAAPDLVHTGWLRNLGSSWFKLQ